MLALGVLCLASCSSLGRHKTTHGSQHDARCSSWALGLPGKDSISSLMQLMSARKLAPLFLLLLPDNDVVQWRVWSSSMIVVTSGQPAPLHASTIRWRVRWQWQRRWRQLQHQWGRWLQRQWWWRQLLWRRKRLAAVWMMTRRQGQRQDLDLFYENKSLLKRGRGGGINSALKLNKFFWSKFRVHTSIVVKNISCRRNILSCTWINTIFLLG